MYKSYNFISFFRANVRITLLRERGKEFIFETECPDPVPPLYGTIPDPLDETTFYNISSINIRISAMVI